MGTLTITANSSSPWTEGDTIELTATITDGTETVASTKVDWSAEPSGAVTFSGSTTTDVTDNKATISATAAAAGPVTFTAAGDTSDSGGTTGTLAGTIAAAAGSYTLIVGSDSDYWAAELTEFEKTFSVLVLDSTMSPVSGEKIDVKADDEALNIERINPEAVSGDNGVVAVGLRLSGLTTESFPTLTFSLVDDPTVSSKKVVGIELLSLSAPRYPLATDLVIDDADINAGVVCNIAVSGMGEGDECYLRLNDDVIPHTITAEDLEKGTVFIPVPESLLINELKNSFYYVVSPAGNTAFSQIATFLVKRSDGGVGVIDLESLDVPQGDDGYINRLDAMSGVDIILPDGRQADNVGQCSLVCKGYANSGEVVNNVIVPYDTPEIADIPVTYNDRDEPLHNQLQQLFLSVGQGTVELTYEITLLEDAKRVKHSSVPVTYFVDVVPPGKK